MQSASTRHKCRRRMVVRERWQTKRGSNQYQRRFVRLATRKSAALPDLEILCRENGLPALQFARTSEAVTSLDLFVEFYTSTKSVMFFPAFKKLSVVNQPTICDLDGVNRCTNLESLCMTECGLTKIANLRNCSKLKCLDLSSNRIRD